MEALGGTEHCETCKYHITLEVYTMFRLQELKQDAITWPSPVCSK